MAPSTLLISYWTALILLILVLCIIAVIGTVRASQRVKADYSEATYFAEQFAEAIGKAMPELSWEQRESVLRATEHIDKGKLARRMSQQVWQWRSAHIRDPRTYHVLVKLRGLFMRMRYISQAEFVHLQHDMRLSAAMKPYIFALSYFDHLLGYEVRGFCAREPELAVRSLAGWIFAQTGHDLRRSSYWNVEKSQA
jgi:hypothetical protein